MRALTVGTVLSYHRFRFHLIEDFGRHLAQEDYGIMELGLFWGLAKIPTESRYSSSD